MALYETATQATTTSASASIDLTNAYFVTPMNSDGKAMLIRTRAEMLEGTLPISKGGTGLSELDGGKLIASSVDGKLFEEVDVNVSLFKGLTGNIQSQLNKSRSYIVSVPSSGWKTITGGYQQSVTVNGITSSDTPIVGLKPTGTTSATVNNEKYAFSCIDKAETGTNSITLTCYDEKPTANITIQLTCV